LAKTKLGFKAWLMKDLLKELIQKGNIKSSRDDILRTVEFMANIFKLNPV